ncbi:hypothetical protein [uncultured Helicobacter sp.]|uniref:hypothetical protein n=1 Tax=uncultured Helicobacter sp. TaxID=175537 RepID=UPI00262954BB|nr:hypothetical protein [uncultured Helicobacter sp.]
MRLVVRRGEIVKTLSFVKVYLDVCLQNLATLYPACGSANSAVSLTLEELEKASCFEKYIDVCSPIT